MTDDATTITTETDASAWLGDAGEVQEPADPDAGHTARQASDPTADVDTDAEAAGDDLEARKYRKRAQTAERELAAVTARLEAAQRSQVTALAEGLAQPGDVLDVALGGVGLDALLDDDGQVDPAKVSDAVAAQLAARPGLGKVTPPPPGTYQQAGQFQTARHTPSKVGGWSEMLTR